MGYIYFKTPCTLRRTHTNILYTNLQNILSRSETVLTAINFLLGNIILVHINIIITFFLMSKDILTFVVYQQCFHSS